MKKVRVNARACVCVCVCVFFGRSTTLVGLDLLIVEISRSHSDTPHSVGLLRESDRHVTGNST